MTKDNGSPRWAVLLLILAGVGVDLATLAWIWETVDLSNPTGTEQALTALAAIVSASLLALGVALGVRRTHG